MNSEKILLRFKISFVDFQTLLCKPAANNTLNIHKTFELNIKKNNYTKCSKLPLQTIHKFRNVVTVPLYRQLES